MRLTRKEKETVEDLLWNRDNGHIEYKRFLMDNFQYHQIVQVLNFIKDVRKVFRNTIGLIGKTKDTTYILKYVRSIDKEFTDFKIQAQIENIECGLEKAPCIKIDILENLAMVFQMRNDHGDGLGLNEVDQLINLTKYILEKWCTGLLSEPKELKIKETEPEEDCRENPEEEE